MEIDPPPGGRAQTRPRLGLVPRLMKQHPPADGGLIAGHDDRLRTPRTDGTGLETGQPKSAGGGRFAGPDLFLHLRGDDLETKSEAEKGIPAGGGSGRKDQ